MSDEELDLFHKNKDISKYIVRTIRKEYMSVPEHIFIEYIQNNIDFNTWLVNKNKLEEDCKTFLTKG